MPQTKKMTRRNIRGRMAKNELARQLGVDRSYITRWENGSVDPSADMLLRICELLDVEPKDYLRAEVDL